MHPLEHALQIGLDRLSTASQRTRETGEPILREIAQGWDSGILPRVARTLAELPAGERETIVEAVEAFIHAAPSPLPSDEARAFSRRVATTLGSSSRAHG